MAKKTKAVRLDSKSERAKLAPRGVPYYASIGRDLHLGYRKGSKVGVWVARRRVAGKYMGETLADADDIHPANGKTILSWAEAQDAARRWASGGDAAAAVEPGAPLSMAQALEDYLKFLEAHRKSAATARNRVKNDIGPALGHRRVDSLTTRELRDWLAALAARPRLTRGKKGRPARALAHPETEEEIRRRRSTANRTLTILKAALNYAFTEGRVTNDTAWRAVKPFREADTAKVHYLTPDEAARLVAACDPGFADLVQGALLTGLRYGELIRLRCGDFTAAANKLTVGKTKSGKPRHVALTEEGRGLFRRLTEGRQPNDIVFLRPDGAPWGASHQARPLARACERAKIDPPATFHILRHSYASALAQKGAPLDVIAAQLGHADARMTTKHYAHLSDDYIAETVRNKLPEFGFGREE
ncbi:site-specific integrase [Methylocystis sp. IM3]|uniref:tyrosine-type recombinase/integrase n=1 Tax=unclassified Methylocystis TaxID=2625913 RepID=UPI0030F511F4